MARGRTVFCGLVFAIATNYFSPAQTQIDDEARSVTAGCHEAIRNAGQQSFDAGMCLGIIKASTISAETYAFRLQRASRISQTSICRQPQRQDTGRLSRNVAGSNAICLALQGKTGHLAGNKNSSDGTAKTTHPNGC
jgi:hypothetical protein